MTRKRVKLAFIENSTERRVSYRKRQKGLLKKARELSTLCDVQMAGVIFGPYHSEPTVFPNHDVAINTFTTFKELPSLEQSKSMATQEKFTKERMQKMEEQLRRVRKENRIREFTNKMYEMLNGEGIPAATSIYGLNDLSYVINQNLKQICEAIEKKVHEEGSTSNASLSTPVSAQMNPSMNIPQMDVFVPMNNYQNYSVSFPQSPALSEIFDWDDNVMMTLFDDDPSFNNINVQDPNHHNNNL